MNRLKTFGKYVLWIILFYIFSNILIFFYLNTSYKSLRLIGNLPEEVTINYSEATSVNGRVKATIKNENNELDNKFLNFRFYNTNGVLLGHKSFKVSDMTDNELLFYFKFTHVESYTVELSDVALNSSEYDSNFSFDKFQDTLILGFIVRLLFM